MKKERTKRRPNIIEAFSLIVVLLALVVYSVNIGININPALAISVVWCMIIAWRCGFSWSEIVEPIWDRLRGVIEIFLIILAIGMFVAAMIFSGTIPTIIYYLITIVSPASMIVLSFVITAIVSVIIGTSWGTVGTVGVIMIAIAQSMGVPLPIVAGAVAGGSHVGQLCSPMADTTNVAAGFARTDTMNMIKRMAHYTIPVIVLSTVSYLVLGFMYGSSSADLASVDLIRHDIASVYNTNPLVILPMVLVFVLTFRKAPILKTLVVSSLIALVFGAVFNGFDIGSGLDAVYSGFNLESTLGIDPSGYSEIFLNLVNRGGALDMVSAALIVIIATMFGTIMTETKAINVIAEALFSHVKSRPALTASSVVVAGMVVGLTSSSFLAGMMPKDLFLKKFEDAGMDSLDLVSGAVSASTQYLTCIPWCDTAVFLTSVTGVSTIAALPYNFFGWGCSVMAIILSFVGIGFKNGKRFVKLTPPQQDAEVEAAAE